MPVLASFYVSSLLLSAKTWLSFLPLFENKLELLLVVTFETPLSLPALNCLLLVSLLVVPSLVFQTFIGPFGASIFIACANISTFFGLPSLSLPILGTGRERGGSKGT